MQTPWGDLPVCDAHVHFFGLRFFDWLGTQSNRNAAGVAAAAGWDLPLSRISGSAPTTPA